MTDFLDHWIVGTRVESHKDWVAKALVTAFPEPFISSELTHARAALAPIHQQLLRRAAQCQGQTLDLVGIKRQEPWLALAVQVAGSGFAKADGAEGRRLLFRVLVEVIADDPTNAKAPSLIKVCHALRIELEELQENAHSRPANPDFPSAWDALPWFGQQVQRYSDDATSAWRNHVSAMVRRALLDPAPPPGSASHDDEGPGSLVVDIAPTGYDSELEGADSDPAIPPGYWLVPEEEVGNWSGWDEKVREEVLGASISTYIPLGRFTPASPTYLSDEQAADEARTLMAEAVQSRQDGDVEVQRRSLAKALCLASATPVPHLARLRWGQPGEGVGRQYPGLLSPCGRWLYRPELALSAGKLLRDEWVHIPLPANLGRELKALGTNSGEGSLVFPSEGGAIQGSQRLRASARPSATQLQRALVCRLVTNRRWGPSLAQYVAGDDLGIDLAPLHYDKISAADLAILVSGITSPWFGEPPGRLEGSLPTHFVGSRRVPEGGAISDALLRIREDWEASSKSLMARITHRTRNLVHGLFLTTGHRPNNNITEVTRRDIGEDDGLAVIFDKSAGPDWMQRPVALAERWVREYQALLSDLEAAANEYPGSALGKAAALAISGAGPVFVAADGLDTVRPFALADYQAGMPRELVETDNFARQFLNYELSKQLPEPLRVAQMGWHGTREGAFADGSPWSVREACAQISPMLDRVLKAVGWRPLEKPGPLKARPLAPMSWRNVEAEHHQAFRSELSKRKVAAANRRNQALVPMGPKLAELLSPGGPMHLAGLVFDGNSLQKAPSQKDPVIVPQKWPTEVVRRLSGGDPRSLEAHAARGWLRDLVLDGRTRKVLTGAVPRRSLERWPRQAGAFLRSSPSALSVARRLDDRIRRSKASRALKTAVTLILHGGYADLSAVLAAMAPDAKISGLASMPSILLVEPVDPGEAPDELPEGDCGRWRHGPLAFHGLAAVALLYWHRSKNEQVNPEALDAELGELATNELSCSEGAAGGLPWLEELVALGRIVNSLRMDGVSRLVGIGDVRPASAPIERLIALRDDLPMGPRSEVVARDWSVIRMGSRKGAPTSPARLIYDLTAAIRHAVESYKADRRKQTSIRGELEAQLRQWIGAAHDYGPEHLVALYALLLLTRGGRRRTHLELTTIQGYVYAVARPLVSTLPSSPMEADSDEWTQAFMAALAMAEASERPGRADALANFHWVLCQAMAVPSVDFTEVFAFAGRSACLADAGFLTKAELRGLSWALNAELETARSQGNDRVAIHEAILRQLVGRVAYSAALRPGEATCLSYRNLPTDHSGRLRVSKNKFQGLKNFNARRCPRLVPDGFGVTTHELLELGRTARLLLGSNFSPALPVMHLIDAPGERQADQKLLDGLSRYLKWSTGELDASPYWLRKTAIRARVERVMADGEDSLWPLRHLLAEIGHADIRTTLASYTHDPVTPFLRWFQQSWVTVDAGRIADAAGRALDTISRKRGGHRLAPSPARVSGRIGEMLRDAPYLANQEVPGAISLPVLTPSQKDGDVPVGAVDVAAALDLVAAGLPDAASAGSDWPAASRRRLLDAISELEMAHGVRLESASTGHGPTDILISPPRRLTQDAGLWELLHQDKALVVLAEVFEAWVQGLGYGVAPNKIVASPADWVRWLKEVPALSELGWEVSDYARAREARSLPAPGDRRLGLWPTLRWLMACAWMHGRVSLPEGEDRTAASSTS